ncbi:MAG: sulfite exporter TauE/SafE family protein [Phycisphaera sp.]|nr:sulfite exporter TauE/SafE family protein [Phycisphaera sp.]
MIELVGTVFLASLLGSLHCAGMCGGLVLFCCGVGDRERERAFPVHVAYHGGRLAAYAIAGAVLGSLGGVLDIGGRLVGIQTIAGWIAALTLVGLGITMIARVFGLKGGCLPLPRFLGRTVEAGYSMVSDASPWKRGLVVGVMSPLLPCGWLWAFLVVAAGTGSLVGGLLVMLVFWAGTVPILLAIGLGAHRITPAFRRSIPLVMGVSVVVVGIMAAMVRLPHAEAVVASALEVERVGGARSEDLVESIGQQDLPCCGGGQDAR